MHYMSKEEALEVYNTNEKKIANIKEDVKGQIAHLEKFQLGLAEHIQGKQLQLPFEKDTLNVISIIES